MRKQRARKGARRIRFVERVVAALTRADIFDVIDYRAKREDQIKQFMYQILLDELRSLHRSLSPTVSDARIKSRAEHSVVWEGDVRRTIHHLQFLGVQHRPDFEVLLPGTRIAVEVKRATSGQSVREGLGQALVYAQQYDFVVFLAIDITPRKTVKASIEEEAERAFLDRLWDLHNVRFVVA